MEPSSTCIYSQCWLNTQSSFSCWIFKFSPSNAVCSSWFHSHSFEFIIMRNFFQCLKIDEVFENFQWTESVVKMVGQEMWTFGLIKFLIISLLFRQVTNALVKTEIKALEKSSLPSMGISGKQIKVFLSSSRSQKCHGDCLKKVTTLGFCRVFGRVYALNFRIFISFWSIMLFRSFKRK